MKLRLPSRANLQLSIDAGSPEDYHLVRLYYAWYAGWFYRQRLRLVSQALGTRPFDSLLDIGTGSGIFIPQLLNHAQKVYGIDIHKSYTGVQKMLQNEGLDLGRVELREGSILAIPYPNASFDAVTCVSVMEHFADPLPALREMHRVLKPHGVLVIGSPVENLITSTLFNALGYQVKDIHPGNHRSILAGLNEVFGEVRTRYFPHRLLALYFVSRVHRP